jgi:hypothetical protein
MLGNIQHFNEFSEKVIAVSKINIYCEVFKLFLFIIFGPFSREYPSQKLYPEFMNLTLSFYLFVFNVFTSL